MHELEFHSLEVNTLYLIYIHELFIALKLTAYSMCMTKVIFENSGSANTLRIDISLFTLKRDSITSKH